MEPNADGTVEIATDDAYRVADTMFDAGDWFLAMQRAVGDQLPELTGVSGDSETDQVVAFAIIRVLRRAAGVGHVLNGVARNLRKGGLEYEETDLRSAEEFRWAELGKR